MGCFPQRNTFSSLTDSREDCVNERDRNLCHIARLLIEHGVDLSASVVPRQPWNRSEVYTRN